MNMFRVLTSSAFLNLNIRFCKEVELVDRKIKITLVNNVFYDVHVMDTILCYPPKNVHYKNISHERGNFILPIIPSTCIKSIVDTIVCNIEKYDFSIVLLDEALGNNMTGVQVANNLKKRGEFPGVLASISSKYKCPNFTDKHFRKKRGMSLEYIGRLENEFLDFVISLAKMANDPKYVI